MSPTGSNFKFHYFPGWVVGWVGGEKSKLKLNSVQLELELGLSLAKKKHAEDRTDVIADGYGNDDADDIFSDLFNWFG